jgi:hypothetical protein
VAISYLSVRFLVNLALSGCSLPLCGYHEQPLLLGRLGKDTATKAFWYGIMKPRPYQDAT